MVVTARIEINSDRKKVWKAITDIENSGEMIAGIVRVSILQKPSDGLIGLKWEETRKMFGKEATETMWITDFAPNRYYITQARSHGSIYITRSSLSDSPKGTRLTMMFTSAARSPAAKAMSFLLGAFIKVSLKKAMNHDLEDIKAFVEKNEKTGI
ncbi:MAG: SRPBCC family protein [Pseudomonadota bacterium]|jgi:hypothetical protein